MREDLQKKFILLSKIAKEKKYAQEYIGLLARRGDIGSIRIGKRWYTTWEWFEEFLENSQKKKTESVCETQVVQPVKVEAEKIAFPAREKEDSIQIKETVPFRNISEVPAFAKAMAGEGEKVYVAQSVTVDVRREEKIIEEPAKITVAVKTKRFEMPVRKNISGDIRGIGEIRKKIEISQVRNFHQERNIQSLPQLETKFKNVFVEGKNENPLPYKEIKFRKNQDVFSPVFETIEETRSFFFPKFVFATGFAIMVFLVAASGYFVFSDGIFKKGTVAGASSERNGGFSGISSGGEYFLASAGDKMKESLSVSRVVVEAVKEKTAKNASPEDAKAILNIN
ncbi:MAG: hypothetical protein V1814_01560 [Candidatus Moraniibacteriota bacterium]